MRTTASRYIDATPEATAALAKDFQCTEKFVYYALTYRKNSDLAKKVRYSAVNNYGAKPMAHYPECATLHDTIEDGRQIMRQHFDNGTTLRIDKRTGETWVINRRGETVMHKQSVTISQLTEIQLYAESL